MPSYCICSIMMTVSNAMQCMFICMVLLYCALASPISFSMLVFVLRRNKCRLHNLIACNSLLSPFISFFIILLLHFHFASSIFFYLFICMFVCFSLACLTQLSLERKDNSDARLNPLVYSEHVSQGL